MVKDIVTSYKDLPSLYQIHIGTATRRAPRAGLLRGREFTMKDAYSFDVTDAGARSASYQAQRDAYERIFTRLGLEYVIVSADAGAMGGSKSEEFLLPTEIGEDTFVRSAGGYAANVEAYVTPSFDPLPIEGQPEAVVYDSPNTPTIETLVALTNAVLPRADGRDWEAADTLKNVVLALTAADGTRELVVVGIPGDRDADMKRAEAAFGVAEVEPANAADFAKHPLLVKGYIGPGAAGALVLGEAGSTGVRYLLDPRVVAGTLGDRRERARRSTLRTWSLGATSRATG